MSSFNIAIARLAKLFLHLLFMWLIYNCSADSYTCNL